MIQLAKKPLENRQQDNSRHPLTKLLTKRIAYWSKHHDRR
jgi:hypothetical protein